MTVASWHILKVGACRHPEIMTRRGGHLCSVNFPALVGLILHRNGPVLFDTGYHARFFAATETFPERFYRWVTPVQYDAVESLTAQLARFGIEPSDIQAIFVSHFHGDHVAGLTDFPGARVFCARAGLERLSRGGRFTRVRQGLLSTLVPRALDATCFEDLPRIPLPGQLAPFAEGIDLLKDGSLIAVELPGHCPGHWGLWVNAKPEAFFIGDAAWTMAAIREGAPPPALTTGLLGDTAVYRDTLKKLQAVQGKVEIIPSHCEETASRWASHGV